MVIFSMMSRAASFESLLPGCGTIRLGDRVVYDFPPEQTTDVSQRACMPVPKDHEVFGLECDNKIFVIAPDRRRYALAAGA
jgi:hypothetical protein